MRDEQDNIVFGPAQKGADCAGGAGCGRRCGLDADESGGRAAQKAAAQQVQTFTLERAI